ncbi:MarR family winged helix-turn-helix transcriptional regulator [Streptacidiphilus sp. P02-A3a]|uniref:MarR family winged helix-turn-helix transcriptional regulator n=1 Tax=Streptacidiphilus sp. P02-A3a TaxID=2704468 RepID=UPI0015FA7897|nr:MarR family transcriptional regulator [Streptacidiphilus sp. P02-A3a]QMU70022.1 MarR family transcriptional regulator [Streptacidiphilus sp. P02-A3a]
MPSDTSPTVLSSRLGYLLKHAQLRYAQASAQALAPLGLDGRDLAVLAVLGSGVPLSQQEAADQLGVDRSTMVGVVDALEARALAERRRSPADRRKNIVELTDQGRALLRRAEHVRQDAERRFLAPLPAAEADTLLRALGTLAAEPGPQA